MNRDLIIGLLVALALHAGLALGGDWLHTKPAPAPAAEPVPVIELAPLPPVEPDTVDYSAASGEPGGGDVSDLVPPMQADNPAPTASGFVQRIQPPPPPGIARSTGAIVIPTRPGTGIGNGTGNGLANLFDLASLDQPPAPRTPIRPVYPSDMSRAGINGEVVVGFMVDSQGYARNAYIVRSSRREFEAEALRAVTRTRFKPGRKNGADVNTRDVSVPIQFNITGN